MKFASAFVVLAAAVASSNANTVGPTVGQDLCCAANQQRAQNGGLPALKWSPELEAAAQSHSAYQQSVGYITHFGNNAKNYDLSDRLLAVGFSYRTAGENVGAQFPSVDSVTTAWMNSPGHRANILATGYTVCGGGLANPGQYYTIDFASPMNPSDTSNLYTLQCSGSKSLGAYTGDAPVAHSPQTTPPPAPKPPVQSTPPSPPKTSTKLTNIAHDAQSTPAAPQQSAAPQSPAAPQPPAIPQPTPPGNGKCKLVPKGSIAAGKCKPCTACGSNGSPFRR
ncbi:hypothetical protein GGI21_000101 [Coemansia aciculifera]|nr:hypothetical protein GGI21_000101 [Coemansia aciculifera]